MKIGTVNFSQKKLSKKLFTNKSRIKFPKWGGGIVLSTSKI